MTSPSQAIMETGEGARGTATTRWLRATCGKNRAPLRKIVGYRVEGMVWIVILECGHEQRQRSQTREHRRCDPCTDFHVRGYPRWKQVEVIG